MNNEYIRINHLQLKPYNTMEIAACAECALFPYTMLGCKQVLQEMLAENPIVLGKGSNTIFQHSVVEAPVIITDLMRNIEYRNNLIICDCGVPLSRLSWFALEHSVTGFEFLEDIPGTVAGGLYMNAGTYEDSIGKLVDSVVVYDMERDEIRTVQRDELSMGWGYRKSCFQHNPWFIIQCCFMAAQQKEYDQILSVMLETKKKRYQKQPRNYPSAGSAFKRPYVNGEPQYIWKLFDAAGLRGYRIGDAQVSEKHPGFIVNIGNATGQDIVNLMNHCKNVVYQLYGIRIEEEWKII